ncbi:hypothetical protein PIB30_088354 [Stylosanthes scabra]|uniref:Uncharacterized protein n=1 Tax=Stylosanthes scabra TaxID=79078 RepID=A0ABU6YSY7_9FABA|nr:hypothetical protein [Stylosanthes scabra]
MGFITAFGDALPHLKIARFSMLLGNCYASRVLLAEVQFSSQQSCRMGLHFSSPKNHHIASSGVIFEGFLFFGAARARFCELLVIRKVILLTNTFCHFFLLWIFFSILLYLCFLGASSWMVSSSFFCGPESLLISMGVQSVGATVEGLPLAASFIDRLLTVFMDIHAVLYDVAGAGIAGVAGAG